MVSRWTEAANESSSYEACHFTFFLFSFFLFSFKFTNLMTRKVTNRNWCCIEQISYCHILYVRTNILMISTVFMQTIWSDFVSTLLVVSIRLPYQQVCKSLRVFHYNMRHCLIKGHQGQMPQTLIKIKLCKTSRYNNAAFLCWEGPGLILFQPGPWATQSFGLSSLFPVGNNWLVNKYHSFQCRRD